MRYGIKINSFDGGLNTKTSETNGEPNESPDLKDIEFDDVGAIESRLGYSVVNSTAVSVSNGFDMLHNYRSSAGQNVLAIYSSLYGLSGSSFVEIAAGQGGGDLFASGTRVWAENALDYAFMSNGTDKYKYNGTDFTLWGVPVPTTAYVTAMSAGNSNLSGVDGAQDFEYRIAFINSTNVESPASNVKTFTASSTCSPAIISFDAPSEINGLAYVSVYRNDYLLETVEADTGSVTDNFEELTTARDETIVDSRPPAIDLFVWHGGFMFGAISDTTDIYYSEINSPESFPPTNLIRVGYGDGLTIRGLAVYNNGLIIAKEDGTGVGAVYVLYMPDSNPENWSLEKLDLSYGSVAAGVMTRFSVYMAMINKNGVFDLSNPDMGRMDSKAISYKIDPNIKALSVSALRNAVAITYNNKLWIAVTSQGRAKNEYIYQYDFIRGESNTKSSAWGKFDGIEAKQLIEYEGELYFGDYDGYLNQLNSGYNNNTSAITPYFKTMFIFGEKKHRENMKVWRYLYVTVDLSGDWDLIVEWRGNFSTGVDGSYSIALDPGGAVWGDAEWGLFDWGRANNRKNVRIPIRVPSKSIQVTFRTENAGEYFKVYDLALHYNLRGAR